MATWPKDDVLPQPAGFHSTKRKRDGYLFAKTWPSAEVMNRIRALLGAGSSLTTWEIERSSALRPARKAELIEIEWVTKDSV